jgi:hypothetical protein
LVPEDGLFTGKIVIKSKNSQFKVQIPYRAHVLNGNLSVNDSITHFHLTGGSKTRTVIRRNLAVKNEFGVPVAVHNLTLPPEARAYFDTENFNPVILQPGETKDLITLSLKEEAWEDRILNSHLVIHTNISNMNVPLLCFHGNMDTVSSKNKTISNIPSSWFVRLWTSSLQFW